MRGTLSPWLDKYPQIALLLVVSAQHCGKFNSLRGSDSAPGVPVVTCRHVINPPNAASERFLQAFGFSEVGRQSAA
jgi:predicted GNAT superfamily acetyltransferase